MSVSQILSGTPAAIAVDIPDNLVCQELTAPLVNTFNIAGAPSLDIVSPGMTVSCTDGSNLSLLVDGGLTTLVAGADDTDAVYKAQSSVSYIGQNAFYQIGLSATNADERPAGCAYLQVGASDGSLDVFARSGPAASDTAKVLYANLGLIDSDRFGLIVGDGNIQTINCQSVTATSKVMFSIVGASVPGALSGVLLTPSVSPLSIIPGVSFQAQGCAANVEYQYLVIG